MPRPEEVNGSTKPSVANRRRSGSRPDANAEEAPNPEAGSGGSDRPAGILAACEESRVGLSASRRRPTPFATLCVRGECGLATGFPVYGYGEEAPTGMAGWIFFGGWCFLQPVPPGCTLYNGRASRLPVVWGTITRDRDRGLKGPMMIVPPGFPMSRSPDPIAVALFDEWLGGIVTELEGG